MRVIVTGGAGFIGSNFVRHLLAQQAGHYVTVLDALTYAGNLASLADLNVRRDWRFVHGDIRDAEVVDRLAAEADMIVNFAAESHVDRSIVSPLDFVRTNVEGTLVLLEASRRYGHKRFLQVSTDEVYGSLGPEGLFTEDTPITPNSPYAASKASADMLVRSYVETHGLPALITRCSNNYGPYHFPEKLIPLLITNLLHDEAIPVYGDGLNVRDWLHVEDHCAAIALVLAKGRPGEVYNVGGQNERTNIDIARKLCAALGKPETSIRHVQDRPGHDKRYAIDATKLRTELGWAPRYDFESGLAATIAWYQANRDWWTPLRDRALDATRERANQVIITARE